MTSNNRASTGPPQTEISESASAPLTPYVLSYNAKGWSIGVTLLDGSEPRDDCGPLAVYQSLSIARDHGFEWALKQLQDRLDRYDPPLATEKDRDVAFNDWLRSKSEQSDVWSYIISNVKETLVVRAEKVPVILRY